MWKELSVWSRALGDHGNTCAVKFSRVKESFERILLQFPKVRSDCNMRVKGASHASHFSSHIQIQNWRCHQNCPKDLSSQVHVYRFEMDHKSKVPVVKPWRANGCLKWLFSWVKCFRLCCHFSFLSYVVFFFWVAGCGGGRSIRMCMDIGRGH